MSLRIVHSKDEGIVSPLLMEGLSAALERNGRALLLVPSFSQALDAQRQLADAGLSLGLSVTTPAAWASERWEVWGDGARIVDDVSRTLICSSIVREAGEDPDSPLRNTPGSVQLLAQLVRRALPWLSDARPPAGLTPAELAVAGLAERYSAELALLGLTEACQVELGLPQLLEDSSALPAEVALSGFPRLDRALREMVAGLAARTEVGFYFHDSGNPGLELQRLTATELEDCAAAAGAEVSHEAAAGRAPSLPRSAELDLILDRVFTPVDESDAVRAGDAFRLLLPAGPSAEAALVSEEVGRMSDAGATDVVIVAPDPAAAWDALAPRLAELGVSGRAQLSLPFDGTEEGRAFLDFARSVADLSELAATWPAPGEVDGVPTVSLGDMSWWPPRDLVDFLYSDISHVDPDRARRLDREWRSNRLLAPSAVLEKLQLPREGSPELAAATRELLRGRVGTAASKLLAPYVQGDAEASPVAPVATAALQAVLDASRSLKELGCGTGPDASVRLSLRGLVSLLELALSTARLRIRTSRDVVGSTCVVRVMSLAEASRLAPRSADALFLLGQTSTESSVSRKDDALAQLLDAFEVEPSGRAMLEARSTFSSALRVARSSLVVERVLFGPDGSASFPSPMLVELLSVLGVTPGTKDRELPQVLGAGCVSVRSEVGVGANASPTGEAPLVWAVETPSGAGMIDESRRELVMPPAQGKEASDLPLLSASQIEVFLECPYKWFSLKRLKLSDSDEGFTGANLGTFAHRVLEVTQAELLARAVERASGGSTLRDMRLGDPRATQGAAYCEERDRLDALAQRSPSAPVAGSSVADPAALEEARLILDEEFEAHLRHQFIPRRGGRPEYQALVAHNAQERGRVRELHDDLSSLLDYESGLFAGFEPRFFEWDFGKTDAGLPYAGVLLQGTVDRIDVDAHGNAIVIDYKHKSPAGFASEYNVFGPDGTDAASFLLPRRVQSLIYAQVVRRAFPDLKVRGALYLCTKGDHALAGAVDADFVDRVFLDRQPSSQALRRIAVPPLASFGLDGPAVGMEALLDATEEAIAERVGDLLSGNVEASPVDDRSCDFCPVMNCERRA